jgi:hypothetical protein
MHECNAHFCVLSISSLTSWDVTGLHRIMSTQRSPKLMWINRESAARRARHTSIHAMVSSMHLCGLLWLMQLHMTGHKGGTRGGGCNNGECDCNTDKSSSSTLDPSTYATSKSGLLGFEVMGGARPAGEADGVSATRGRGVVVEGMPG